MRQWQDVRQPDRIAYAPTFQVDEYKGIRPGPFDIFAAYVSDSGVFGGHFSLVLVQIAWT